MLRNMLRPDRNLYLDEILTYDRGPFVSFDGGGGWNNQFYNGFSKTWLFLAPSPHVLEHN